MDRDATSACTLDFRAKSVEKICKILNLGFCGSGFDHGGAFGKNRGHHDVVGAENGRTMSAAQVDFSTTKTALRCRDDDISALELCRRTECFQSAQVKIYRTVADDAATWQRNHSAAGASE